MRWGVIAIAVLIGACSQEPDFDERYENAAKKIEQTAKDIDADIGRREQTGETDTDNPVEAQKLNHEG